MPSFTWYLYRQEVSSSVVLRSKRMDGNSETSAPKLFSPRPQKWRGGGRLRRMIKPWSNIHYEASLERFLISSGIDNTTVRLQGEQSPEMEARSRHWSRQNPPYTDFLADLFDDRLRRWRHQKVQIHEAPATYGSHKSYRDYHNYTRQWQL